MIIFVQFQDDIRSDSEWPLDELPNWADEFIDNEIGSPYSDLTMSDYWNDMSQGNFDFIGDVFPELVILGDEEDYLNDPNANYFDANLDVFELMEDEIDWSYYDNWKFENGEFVFSEGDADGYVDMILMIYRSPGSWFTRFSPLNFTAIATLGSEDHNYVTHDNLTIRFEGNSVSTIGSGITYRSGLRGHYPSIETMAHEFGHYLFGGNHSTYGGIMGGGTYALSGWELNKLGYVAWSVADQYDYTITLGDMIDDADLLMIPLDELDPSQQFYLVENHQRISKYDQIIRGGTLGGAYNWETSVGSGIYIWLITSGASFPVTTKLMASDGHWNWAVVDTFENSILCGCDLPLFKRQSVNRNTGNSDRQITTNWGTGVEFMWYDIEPLTKVYWLSRDRIGDNDDPWTYTSNKLFTPWSSPSSYNSGATNVSVQLYNQNGIDLTIKVFTEISSAKNLAPAKPQWVRITPDGSNKAVVNWEANQEPDLKQMKIWKAQTTGSTEPTTYFNIATINAWSGGNRVTSWTDINVTIGTGEYNVFYKVSAVDSQSLESVRSNFDWIERSDDIDKSTIEEDKISYSYNLYNNYPNPFNPSTQIDYSIQNDGFVSLTVFDVLGKEIETLVSENQNAGNNSIRFDAANLPSGVYMYRLKINDYVSVKKMLLLK